MNSYHSNHESHVPQISGSLNLLKQLHAKLSNDRKNSNEASKIKQNIYTHMRVKTEPYDAKVAGHSYGASVNPFTIGEKVQSQARSRQGEASAYSHSQPTMVECNQNEHSSAKQILKQNRKLKKYVNCLLQMNDYLKNQLVRKDQMMGVNKLGNTFELQLMRMQIEYLKELNRDKQLEIRRGMNLGYAEQLARKNTQRAISHNKKHLKTMSASQINERGARPRPSSVYDYGTRISEESEEETPYNQYPINSMGTKHGQGHTPSKKNSSSKKDSNLMSNLKTTGSFKKKKPKNSSVQNPGKKCRLCYI